MASTDAKSSGAGKAMLGGLAAVATVAGLAWAIDPTRLYDWMKALHVIAVIAWMAGLLYLPRLFVYHADAAAGSAQSETFKVMEIRLLRYIMTPAMVVTWIVGLYIAWDGFAFRGGWLHAKILLVVLLSAAHMYMAKAVRNFASDQDRKGSRHWRFVNEVPTLLMIGIVILVIVKPF